MQWEVILIVLGLLAILGELFLPGGIMGIFGIGLLLTGILLYFGVQYEISIFVGVLASAITAVIVYMYWKRLKAKPVKTGGESFIGLDGKIISCKDGKGLLNIKGEEWSYRSHSEKEYKKGTKVTIIGFEGVYLEVE
ncbi:hypothetical protein J4450_05365 [Candidatus Micrarchaeota archaeon]|nr:hypothetical protein [Candidatus Micrarchaeota archaeon]